MNPAIIALILGVLQDLIQSEPAIAAMVQQLFSKGIPTEADWEALRASVLVPFEQLAPKSAAQIAAATAPPAPPAPPAAPAAADANSGAVAPTGIQHPASGGE